MNEFTKEELQIILGYVSEINRKYETTDEMENLHNKVQFINDFTKEELYMLAHGILLSILPDNQERYAPLYNKIQVMIENYQCDHQADGICYTASPEQRRCSKCREFF